MSDEINEVITPSEAVAVEGTTHEVSADVADITPVEEVVNIVPTPDAIEVLPVEVAEVAEAPKEEAAI